MQKIQIYLPNMRIKTNVVQINDNHTRELVLNVQKKLTKMFTVDKKE